MTQNYHYFFEWGTFLNYRICYTYDGYWNHVQYDEVP
jgi:hypothetical protein